MDGSDILLAGGCSCVTWVIVRAILIAQMSNVSLADAAGEYLVKESVKITGSNDNYLYTREERTPRSKK